MSEVVHLKDRMKPVRYSVEIDHYANGKVTVFLERLPDTEHNRREVAEILTAAAEMLLNPPESSA